MVFILICLSPLAGDYSGLLEDDVFTIFGCSKAKTETHSFKPIIRYSLGSKIIASFLTPLAAMACYVFKRLAQECILK